MKIYYFLFEVAPAPNTENFEEAGGAYINCWVKSDSESDAAKKARTAIQNDGWLIVTLEENFIAEKEMYLDLPESLELFEQAEVEGEAYLLHTWPPEPQENDTIH